MTREPVDGDKVRVYGHAYDEVPDGFVGIYRRKWVGGYGNYVVDTPGFNSITSNTERLFDRVELVEDDAVSFKAGDKVNAFEHVYGAFSDEEAQEATYVRYDLSLDANYPHVVSLKGRRISLNFKRVEAVVKSVEDYKQKVLLPVLDREVEERGFDKDEYERLLKVLDITRPLPDLPTGKNALVECKWGNVSHTIVSPTAPSLYWKYVRSGASIDAESVQNAYVRTIFEGEK